MQTSYNFAIQWSFHLFLRAPYLLLGVSQNKGIIMWLKTSNTQLFFSLELKLTFWTLQDLFGLDNQI